MSDLGSEKYVRLTTFTKDGRPKPTPVWIADLGDGTLGFTTGLDSWKVKRIRNTPSVELAPSDARGRIEDGAETVSAIAEVRTDAGYEPILAAIKAKYGWQFTAITMLERVRNLRRRSHDDGVCGIVLTPER